RRRFTAIISIFLALFSIVTATVQLFTSLSSVHISLPPISFGQISNIIAATSVIITILSFTAVASRYVFAALSEIKLGKDDIYFIIALVVAVGSVLIGHFWREWVALNIKS